MTLLDDLHALRVRANMIERNVSALRPDGDEYPRAFEIWADTMALTSAQYHAISLALRDAVDAELGCGPTRAELEADAAAVVPLSPDGGGVALEGEGLPSFPRSRVPDDVTEPPSSRAWWRFS